MSHYPTNTVRHTVTFGSFVHSHYYPALCRVSSIVTVIVDQSILLHISPPHNCYKYEDTDIWRLSPMSHIV